MKHTVLPFVVSAVLTVSSTAQESTPLKYNDDGSLTIYVQAEEPKDAEQRPNWLPAPSGSDFSLYVRAYWPKTAITDGAWTLPAVTWIK